jgi:hypothetical protein
VHYNRNLLGPLHWVDLSLQRIKRNIFEEYGVDTLTIDRDYKK